MHCRVALAMQASSCFTAFMPPAHGSKPSPPALQREMLEDEPRLLAAAQEEHDRAMRNKQVWASMLAAKSKSLAVVAGGVSSARVDRWQEPGCATAHSFVCHTCCCYCLCTSWSSEEFHLHQVLPLCACSCKTASPS